jgi:hypothetical protein
MTPLCLWGHFRCSFLEGMFNINKADSEPLQASLQEKSNSLKKQVTESHQMCQGQNADNLWAVHGCGAMHCVQHRISTVHGQPGDME